MNEAKPRGARARSRPHVYGHRGTRSGAPENTLPAMQRALAQGADGVELDVRACRSGEVVVLHDPDLVRVGGSALRAADATLSELQRPDLGHGARVPTLAQALSLVLGAGRLLNVELKPDVPSPSALIDGVLDCLQGYDETARTRLVLSSFSAAICAELCARAPALEVALLFEASPSAWPAGIRAVHPRHDLLDAGTIADYHARGLRVRAFTVNDPARARELTAAGVDALISDDVPAILSALEG